MGSVDDIVRRQRRRGSHDHHAGDRRIDCCFDCVIDGVIHRR